MKPYLILILALVMTGCHKHVTQEDNIRFEEWMNKNCPLEALCETNQFSYHAIVNSNMVCHSINLCSPHSINVDGTNIIEGAITIASGSFDPICIYMDTNNVLCFVFVDKSGVRKFKIVQSMEEFK